MKSVAIVYNSQHGQTAKIAERLRQNLIAAGLHAVAFSLDDGKPLPVPLDRFDATIVGGPVYVGKFSPELIRWTREAANELNQKASAFFSVSLNAADKRPEAREMDHRLIDGFLQQTGLKPKLTASLIGSLMYRNYGLLMRWMMKRISAKAGGPTDTSKNHELTDWAKVEAFGREFATSLTESQVKAALVEAS